MRIVRAPRMLMTIFFFNLVLAMVGITSIAAIMNRTSSLSNMDYSTVVRVYELLALVDGFLVIVMMPTLTAGGICHEREKNTFDTLYVSGISASSIIMGKLMAALSIVMTIVVSTLPLLSLAFVFGGIRYLTLIAMVAILFVHAAYIGSMSLAFSAYAKTITFSITGSYAAIICTSVGTVVMCYLFNAVGMGFRWLYYILLFNPAYTLVVFIFRQVGDDRAVSFLHRFCGLPDSGFVIDNWSAVSISVQLIVTAALIIIAMSGISIYPRRCRNK
ncbi:MAG: hypothetical protein K6F92_03805 [Lachnospiraceae bacterium]|nr:hypothetical protein [Lachnospiraceae bacterium]